MTLLAVGLVTTLLVTFVGLIIGLISAVGWFRSVFPTPKHTFYPLAEADRRPAPVRVSPRRIDHLQYGESSHRTRIPVEVHRYSAGILGGLAGGAAMAVLAMAYGLVAQHSIWYPINLMAAAGVPSLATASLATLREFSAAGLTVAISESFNFFHPGRIALHRSAADASTEAGMAVWRGDDSAYLDCSDLSDL